MNGSPTAGHPLDGETKVLGEKRDPKALREFVDSISKTIQRTLEAADADGVSKPWWRGHVRSETGACKPELRVGFVFDLRDQPSPMGQLIGRYRLVGMAQAPEGYVSLVGYADSFKPANGAPVPAIATIK